MWNNLITELSTSQCIFWWLRINTKHYKILLIGVHLTFDLLFHWQNENKLFQISNFHADALTNCLPFQNFGHKVNEIAQFLKYLAKTWCFDTKHVPLRCLDTKLETLLTILMMVRWTWRRTPPIMHHHHQCTLSPVSASTHSTWPPAPARTKTQFRFGWGPRPRWTTGTTIETDNKTEPDITGVYIISIKIKHRKTAGNSYQVETDPCVC